MNSSIIKAEDSNELHRFFVFLSKLKNHSNGKETKRLTSLFFQKPFKKVYDLYTMKNFTFFIQRQNEFFIIVFDF